MKFGHYLELNLIPEWKSWYVDYGGLKAVLKEIKQERRQSDAGEQEEEGSFVRRYTELGRSRALAACAMPWMA